MRNKLYTLEDDLKKRLKDPEFRRLWKESEVEYQLARKLIEKRLKQKISQRELARKVKTTQAVISRVESMSANPSLGLLKRLAGALDSRLEIRLVPK
ncbi:helix-turn-helix transcriptional regulator [Candidatus Gottesmanbacteria bacterium]|nr:helix-turn-helix transcriptional regulator [Candidatus Gottesmanbacteria bacterium]